MYTSRSSIELYQECPRRRYLHDFVLGTGVVPLGRSPHLVTGTAIHEGVGHLLRRIMLAGESVANSPSEVEAAVIVATSWFQTECANKKWYGKGVATDQQQEFTFREQLALVEGLVRAWAISEMPKLVQRYKVVGSEREIVVKMAEGIQFQARVDAELQDISDNSTYNYSLKSCKEWSTRMEEGYGEDLQGITEIWAIEEESRLRYRLAMAGVLAMEKLVPGTNEQVQKNQLQKIQEYLKRIVKPKRVMGVRFCFLVKGNRVQSDKSNPDSLWVTYSPLIRGYKRFTPSSVEYAHSWFFPNVENRSGRGTLGKGWEPFNVWESKDWTVKSWIDSIKTGEVQPECGDIIKAQVVTPVEYFRNQREIEEAILEVSTQELLIASKVHQEIPLELHFPKFRRSCHWPTKCEYHKICYKPEVAADILGSGFYERRIPHHKAEAEAVVKKYEGVILEGRGK